MVKPYRLRLEVAVLPMLNASANVAWYVKTRDRKRWGYLMRAALGRQAKPAGGPLELARVTFTRFSSREPDGDNLVASFKGVRDLLMPPSKRNPGGLSLIVDDSPEHLEAVYQWERAKASKGRIEIIVEAVPAAEGR